MFMNWKCSAFISSKITQDYFAAFIIKIIHIKANDLSFIQRAAEKMYKSELSDWLFNSVNRPLISVYWHHRPTDWVSIRRASHSLKTASETSTG